MKQDAPSDSFGSMGNFDAKPPVMNAGRDIPISQTAQPSGVISSGPVRREQPKSNTFALGRMGNSVPQAPAHDFSNSSLFNKDALDSILGTNTAPEVSPLELSPVKNMMAK